MLRVVQLCHYYQQFYCSGRVCLSVHFLSAMFVLYPVHLLGGRSLSSAACSRKVQFVGYLAVV